MAKKKKKRKPLPPRAKRMKRSGRLQSAPHWIPKYPGKNIVRGYAKHYGVDLLCAAKELQMLGVPVSGDYVRRLRATVEAKAEARRKRKEEERRARELEELADADWNEDFAYIAGYTSGGAPFGVTWEEMDETPPWVEEDEELRVVEDVDQPVDDPPDLLDAGRLLERSRARRP